MASTGSGNGRDPGGTPGQISPEDREAIRQRSSDIGKKLDAVKARRAPIDPAAAKARGQAYSQAMRIAAELVVGLAVGGFIGWALDRQFGTAPLLMIVFVIFGFAAGLLNVVRAARRMQAEAEPLQRAAKPAADDSED